MKVETRRCDMIKRLLCLSIVTVAILTGCVSVDSDNNTTEDTKSNFTQDTDNITDESKQEKYSNLNFSDAKLNEYKPESGEWYAMECKLIDLEDEGETLLQTVLDELGEELTPEDAYFSYIVVDKDTGYAERHTYTLAEKNTADGFEKKGADILAFDNGTVHVEINCGGQIDYWFPKKSSLVSGEDPQNPIRFFSYGNNSCTYDLEDTPANYDMRYLVGNKEQSIGEAAERLKKTLNDSDVFRTNTMSLYAKSVDVMKYKSGSYGYWYTFGYEYDGVPLLYHIWFADGEQISNHVVVNGLGLYAGTFSDNGLDGMWSIGGFQILKPEIRKIGEVIDYDKACSIVSELLTDKHVFDVNNVTLQYAEIADISGAGEGATIAPVWIFELTHLNRSNWGAMYVIINAETSEVMIYHT